MLKNVVVTLAAFLLSQSATAAELTALNFVNLGEDLLTDLDEAQLDYVATMLNEPEEGLDIEFIDSLGSTTKSELLHKLLEMPDEWEEMDLDLIEARDKVASLRTTPPE